MRRIYIAKKLRTEASLWLSSQHKCTGYIFEEDNKPLDAGIIRKHLKGFAAKYHLDPKVMHPHSFRHRFAKSFIERYQDVTLLADLLGHESIETTRIYLRRTAGEQQAIVDKIVTW